MICFIKSSLCKAIWFLRYDTEGSCEGQRYLRDLIRYFRPWDASRVPPELWHTIQAAVSLCRLFILKTQERIAQSVILISFLWWHISTRYLCSCSPCKCEQHGQPLHSTLSVVVACISECWNCTRYILKCFCCCLWGLLCINLFIVYFMCFQHDINQCIVRSMSIIV